MIDCCDVRCCPCACGSCVVYRPPPHPTLPHSFSLLTPPPPSPSPAPRPQDFLNNVCTNIIHMQKKKLKYYSGNYDQFIQTRAELEENQMKKFKWEQAQISHMKEYIARRGTVAMFLSTVDGTDRDRGTGLQRIYRVVGGTLSLRRRKKDITSDPRDPPTDLSARQ